MKFCQVVLKSQSDGSFDNMDRLLTLLSEGWKRVLQTPPAKILSSGNIPTHRISFSVVLYKAEEGDDIVDLQKLRQAMSTVPLDINDLD